MLCTHAPTWELGTQRHALPVLAAVRGVQQDGRLAHNPALIPIEVDGVEAVVEALVLGRLHRAGRPRLAAIKGLQQGLPGAQQEACIQ
eukprot:1137150-Pelagomonas_calceolata.AAC.6